MRNFNGLNLDYRLISSCIKSSIPKSQQVGPHRTHFLGTTPLRMVQFSSVTQSCLTLCDPMDCSTPGFPVHHQLPKLVQIHLHWVRDAIQPSHPLSSPFPSTFNLTQHQDLFKWVNSSLQMAKGLEFQLQHQSFQWIFRTDFLENWLVGSPGSTRDSQESSLAPQLKASILWCSAFT